MVSVSLSAQVGKMETHFVEVEVKINGTYE